MANSIRFPLLSMVAWAVVFVFTGCSPQAHPTAAAHKSADDPTSASSLSSAATADESADSYILSQHATSFPAPSRIESSAAPMSAAPMSTYERCTYERCTYESHERRVDE